MGSERVCPQCQADLGHGPGPLCGPCTLARHGTTLDPAQQASAGMLAALRAVIAGVRQRKARILGTLPDNFTTLMAVQAMSVMKDDLTTLASACERLAEENERMRAVEAIARELVAVAYDAAAKLGHPGSLSRCVVFERERIERLEAAITPAPAGSPT